MRDNLSPSVSPWDATILQLPQEHFLPSSSSQLNSYYPCESQQTIQASSLIPSDGVLSAGGALPPISHEQVPGMTVHSHTMSYLQGPSTSTVAHPGNLRRPFAETGRRALPRQNLVVRNLSSLSKYCAHRVEGDRTSLLQGRVRQN